MYYVIEFGGKQYLANKGKILSLPKINSKVGDEIELNVLSSLGESADFSPSTIKARIEEHKKDRKIIVLKKIRRHRHEKKIGHRTCLTLVSVL